MNHTVGGMKRIQRKTLRLEYQLTDADISHLNRGTDMLVSQFLGIVAAMLGSIHDPRGVSMTERKRFLFLLRSLDILMQDLSSYYGSHHAPFSRSLLDILHEMQKE